MNPLRKYKGGRTNHLALLLPILLLVSCGSSDGAPRWLATWSAAPHTEDTPLVVEDTTLRQELRTSIGGDRIRVRLSNRFGTTPLRIEAATVGVANGAASVAATSIEPIEFSGERTVGIAPGSEVVSDPVDLSPPALETLSVSLFFAQRTPLAATHGTALRESYFAAGNQTEAPELSSFSRRGSWLVLIGVDVETTDRPEVIVALGDSITDGFGAQQVNGSWPERLAALFGGSASVVNAGIDGNRVLRTGKAAFGPSALTRFDADVLSQSGATTLVILEGINDIQAPSVPFIFGDERPVTRVTSAELIAGLAELAVRARSAGLSVVGGTLLPYRFLTNLIDDGEIVRSEVNEWIRNSGTFDAVIDFEAAVRDPHMPTQMLPEFDSGDTLHPSDAGYQAMAEEALATLQGPSEPPPRSIEGST